MSRAEELRIRRVIASEAGKCSNCTTRPVLPGRMSCAVCTAASRSRLAKRTARPLSVSGKAYAQIVWIADAYGLTYGAAVDLALAATGGVL